MTVKQTIKWLQSLPEEFQTAQFESTLGGMPQALKRIVAYRFKDGSGIGVVANPVGNHLPFDDSIKWIFWIDGDGKASKCAANNKAGK